MRRFTFIILAIIALAAAGCVPMSLVNTPTPGPNAGTPTLMPPPVATIEATATSTAAEQPAATVPAATEPAAATVAPTTAPAAPASAPTSAPGSGSVATFTSTRLGITFNYLTSQDGQQFGTLEQGDKVYVYAGNMQPTTGQWVQVFQKPAAQSLTDAIKAQVLQGYSLADCLVTPVESPENGQSWPGGYSFAQIKLPQVAGETPEQLQASARKCPQPYAAIGGLAYFVADANHPTQFVFFSIGQYGIPAGPQKPWQTTLRFLGSSTAAAATPSPSNGSTPAPYIDDRSSAQAVITSYFNAIDRQEYARAYSYWNAAAGQQAGLAPFPQFRQGYADTKSVQLTTGAVTHDEGAGQLYYWTPVTLVAQTTGGATQTYVGCYRMHLGRPEIQGVPPFMPLAIESASVKQVANNADTQSLMAGACANGGQPMPPASTPAPGDISANRYLDDRSDGVQVLRSLFNAINSKQYVRAYSYWEPSSTQLPAFDAFQQGYADTASVDLTAGTETIGAAAGNLYYSVPAVLVATHVDGSKATFAGCYTLHMGNPAMQVEPPFNPLGIQSASVRQVPNNSDPQPLLAGACSQ
jgi:hypothetical protein